MRKEQQSRPDLRVLKSLMVCATIAASLILHSPSLMAAEEATGATSTAPSACSINPSEKLKNLFTEVKQYLGIRYRFGGDTPSGFDCSGFVRFMFNKEFNVNLPRSSREMATIGTRIDRNELRPGDLVFFKNAEDRINHVGIFVGNDTFVHSSLSKGITRDTLNESYYSKRFATGVRILDIQGNRIPDDFNNLFDESNNGNSPS
ncbi:C40 family peptidase [Chlorobaculum tepidum]|jgi:cell wall-associated NlpC family hydrolase|nr:NlpC/P60 family protein [Chlorobaculum tepidum]